MSKVLITGGTGALGRLIASRIDRHDKEIAILTSRTDTVDLDHVTVYHGDLARGTGLADAIHGSQTIIHCASNPRDFQSVDIEGTMKLLAAIPTGEKPHIIYISMVGVDQSTYPYYQAKWAVERQLANSGYPFSILRTTQFHHFVEAFIEMHLADAGSESCIPSGLRFQSVDCTEVADRLISMAAAGPSGLAPDFGGPEIITLETMFKQYLESYQMPLSWETKPLDGPRYALFRSGINLCPAHREGRISWREFLYQRRNG
ncbi:SDR family oxidoreductase [Sphingobacterium suaedae]|uniref:SDR family oxidoreductase n=1 Tax=Sphingobacterium suaedae TaxID=1686402 RepID=A0ABW5KE54_9SPHI